MQKTRCILSTHLWRCWMEILCKKILVFGFRFRERFCFDARCTRNTHSVCFVAQAHATDPSSRQSMIRFRLTFSKLAIIIAIKGDFENWIAHAGAVFHSIENTDSTSKLNYSSPLANLKSFIFFTKSFAFFAEKLRIQLNFSFSFTFTMTVCSLFTVQCLRLKLSVSLDNMYLQFIYFHETFRFYHDRIWNA